ncbi:MAG: response regulator [Verrucomicrobia bacterium]|nr:response regulator [Verrucomicrobiota bacterium]
MNFNGTILLVDDEPHIRKFVSLILKQLGTPFLLEAGNGEEAVEVYKRENPDLVLLDISMPKVDGLETLKRIRAIDPDAVVIMLTSMANRQSIEEALNNGAANYIRKDTPKEEIAKSLTDTIDECFSLDE